MGDRFAPRVAVHAFEKGCSPKGLACARRSVTLAKFGHIPENTLACFYRFFSSTRVVFAAGVLLFLCRSALEKTEFFFEKMLFYFSCSVYNSTESQDKDLRRQKAIPRVLWHHISQIWSIVRIVEQLWKKVH